MHFPVSRMLEETAFIAYYFHWPPDEILSLSHFDRQDFCRRITRINQELNHAPENVFEI